MQALDGLLIILSDILPLVTLHQVISAQRLKSYKDAPHAGHCRLFDQVAPEDGIDGAGPLEHPVHPFHAFEQGSRKTMMTQQMIVEKIQVAARKTVDLQQSSIHFLCVKAASSFEKGIFITEIAVMRAAARDDDGVWNEITAPIDQVSPDRRNAFNSTLAVAIDLLGTFITKIFQESRKNIFS